jgi:hypothetical protein
MGEDVLPILHGLESRLSPGARAWIGEIRRRLESSRKEGKNRLGMFSFAPPVSLANRVLSTLPFAVASQLLEARRELLGNPSSHSSLIFTHGPE